MTHGRSLTPGSVYHTSTFVGPWKTIDCPYTKWQRVTDPDAPHEVMLVLDAGTGQNALAQAAQFQQWVGVTGLSLTKLDGTAKGGVIFAIAKKLGLPIRFIGVGEAVEDLRPFEASQFIEALFAGDDAAA